MGIRKCSGQVFRCLHCITPSWLMQEAMLRSRVLRNLGWIQEWVGLTPWRTRQNQPAKGQEAGESGDPSPTDTQATPALPRSGSCLFLHIPPFPAKPCRSRSAWQNPSQTTVAQEHGSQEIRVWMFNFFHSLLEKLPLLCKMLLMRGVWLEFWGIHGGQVSTSGGNLFLKGWSVVRCQSL